METSCGVERHARVNIMAMRQCWKCLTNDLELNKANIFLSSFSFSSLKNSINVFGLSDGFSFIFNDQIIILHLS